MSEMNASLSAARQFVRTLRVGRYRGRERTTPCGFQAVEARGVLLATRYRSEKARRDFLSAHAETLGMNTGVTGYDSKQHICNIYLWERKKQNKNNRKYASVAQTPRQGRHSKAQLLTSITRDLKDHREESPGVSLGQRITRLPKHW